MLFSTRRRIDLAVFIIFIILRRDKIDLAEVVKTAGLKYSPLLLGGKSEPCGNENGMYRHPQTVPVKLVVVTYFTNPFGLLVIISYFVTMKARVAVRDVWS